MKKIGLLSIFFLYIQISGGEGEEKQSLSDVGTRSRKFTFSRTPQRNAALPAVTKQAHNHAIVAPMTPTSLVDLAGQATERLGEFQTPLTPLTTVKLAKTSTAIATILAKQVEKNLQASEQKTENSHKKPTLSTQEDQKKRRLATLAVPHPAPPTTSESSTPRSGLTSPAARPSPRPTPRKNHTRHISLEQTNITNIINIEPTSYEYTAAALDSLHKKQEEKIARKAAVGKSERPRLPSDQYPTSPYATPSVTPRPATTEYGARTSVYARYEGSAPPKSPHSAPESPAQHAPNDTDIGIHMPFTTSIGDGIGKRDSEVSSISADE